MAERVWDASVMRWFFRRIGIEVFVFTRHRMWHTGFCDQFTWNKNSACFVDGQNFFFHIIIEKNMSSWQQTNKSERNSSKSCRMRIQLHTHHLMETSANLKCTLWYFPKYYFYFAKKLQWKHNSCDEASSVLLIPVSPIQMSDLRTQVNKLVNLSLAD